MQLDNINEKRDFLSVIDAVINNKAQIDDKIGFLKETREKVKGLFLKKGDIPPSNFVKLYFLLNNIEIEEDEYINSHIEMLKNYYENCSLDEKFLINNLLFVLDILNGNVKRGFEEYVKRGLLFKIDQNNYQNGEFTVFRDFVLKGDIDEKLMIETVKDLIDTEHFLSLNDTEKRAVFVNTLSFIWNNKKMYNNRIWLELFDTLVKLLDRLIELEMIEEQMYVHFFTYHIFGNNIEKFEDWYKFSEKVEKKASEFYKRWGDKHKLLEPKSGVTGNKIGLLIDRLVINSPFRVIYSLLSELAKEYDVYVYSMNYVDKQPDSQHVIDSLEAIGVKVLTFQNYFNNDGYYYSHLKKALMLREAIIKDGIDYLITMAFGYDIPNFIFSNRSAPVQIFWSHGNCTSEVLNIDKKISHFAQKCDGFEVFKVPIAKEFLIGSEDEKKQGEILKKSLKQTFGEDSVFIGSIGRLIKIDNDEYIKTVSKIMKQNPNTVYLACGAGHQDNIRKKLKKYGIDEKRFIFTGQVNPHVFGWVIDLYLDSFPIHGGQSVEEFRAKGGVVLRYINRQSNEMDKFYNQIFEEFEWEEIIKLDLEDLKKKVYATDNINIIRNFNNIVNICDIKNNPDKIIVLFLFRWLFSIDKYVKSAEFFINNPDILQNIRKYYPTLYFEGIKLQKNTLSKIFK